MPSVFIKTYGCQMNERDSEAVAAQLVARGWSLAPTENAADVVLLNTCSVRDFAEQKALNKMETLVGQASRVAPQLFPRSGRTPESATGGTPVQREPRKQIFGYLGCMAQSRGQELIDRLPDVDLVLGTQKFHRAAEYLEEIISGAREKIVDVAEEQGSEATIREHLLNGNAKKSVTAFLSIMQGCNQYCTFCIVPYTRGEERSRTVPDIVNECRELVSRGVKEITLLGQIVTSYGKRGFAKIDALVPRGPSGESVGMRGILESAPPHPSPRLAPGEKRDKKSPFVLLLEAVHEIEGLERIRFTSPHPKGYGNDLIEAYTRLSKLVEHAHLPVQSGSNRVLKLMHRGYTRERFLGLVEKLRRARPGIGVSTDLIVGFPGETEADFAETLSLAREVEFDQAFIFKYSPRRDTPAAGLPDQVPQAVREERNQMLLQTINEIAARKYRSFVGRQVQILVEGPSKKNSARLMGRTRCNKIVVFDGNERHRGQLLDVKITRAGSFTLYGDPAVVNL